MHRKNAPLSMSMPTRLQNFLKNRSGNRDEFTVERIYSTCVTWRRQISHVAPQDDRLRDFAVNFFLGIVLIAIFSSRFAKKKKLRAIIYSFILLAACHGPVSTRRGEQVRKKVSLPVRDHQYVREVLELSNARGKKWKFSVARDANLLATDSSEFLRVASIIKHRFSLKTR